jgi:hypothetical protein
MRRSSVLQLLHFVFICRAPVPLERGDDVEQERIVDVARGINLHTVDTGSLEPAPESTNYSENRPQ